MIANHEKLRDQNPSSTESKVRGRDRRPKGVHPMRRRSICLSPQLDQLAMNERLRRNMPSVSAFIEYAVAKEVRHRAQPEEADVLDELRLLRLAFSRFERDTAERDVIQVELIAGLARAHFATVPQPDPDERQARIAEAKVHFERFLDAVGRRIESGETTLAQLPDLPTAEPPAGTCAGEENLSAGSGGEGAHGVGV